MTTNKWLITVLASFLCGIALMYFLKSCNHDKEIEKVQIIDINNIQNQNKKNSTSTKEKDSISNSKIKTQSSVANSAKIKKIEYISKEKTVENLDTAISYCDIEIFAKDSIISLLELSFRQKDTAIEYKNQTIDSLAIIAETCQNTSILLEKKVDQKNTEIKNKNIFEKVLGIAVVVIATIAAFK